MRDRLYQLFITDDRARWKYFMISVSLATAVGTGLFALGMNEKVALISVSLFSMVIFSSLALRYCARQPLKQTQHVFTDSRRNMLVWVKLLLIGAADWVVGFALSDTATVLAFANAAAEGVRNDKVIASTARLMVATAVIDSQIGNAPKSSRPKFISARALLSSAQTYAQIREKVPAATAIRSEAELRNFTEKLERPVWLQGGLGSALMFGGHGEFAMATGRDMIFESLTLEAPPTSPPMRPPTFLKLIGEPRVIVKNCTIRSLSQDLSNIVWFDVLFDECDLEIPRSNLTLVNVSFKNCSISCDDTLARDVPALCSGSASSITFEI